jgi:multidrug efflux system membrane fusion protein
MFDWLATGGILPFNPATAVRGPKQSFPCAGWTERRRLHGKGDLLMDPPNPAAVFRVRAPRPLLGAALVVLHLLAATSAVAQGAPPNTPPPITVAKPVVKDIREWDEFIGRFEAVDEVEIRARVSGFLEKVHFHDGATVKAGDPLFTIDQRPYRAALQEAEATLASAKARLDFAAADLERAESLRRTGNIPEQVFDQRRQTLLSARADLDRSQATLNRARLDIEFTQIRAPLAGRVSRKLISEGNLVNANQTVLTNIVSLDPIHFYFDVDERSYLSYTQMALEGTRPSSRTTPNEVYVALSSEREPTRRGRMDFVDNRLDAATGTMRGRAVFDNKDLALTPGLFGRIRLIGSGVYRGVLLPDEAVGADQDRRVVYVVGDDNKLVMRPVRLGPRIDGYRVIRDGIKGDETLVVGGLVRVRPGMLIQPQMTTLPPTREPPAAERG